VSDQPSELAAPVIGSWLDEIDKMGDTYAGLTITLQAQGHGVPDEDGRITVETVQLEARWSGHEWNTTRTLNWKSWDWIPQS
jgi:hypothetical protein